MLDRNQCLRIKKGKQVSSLHDKNAVVPADKASNNIFLVKNYYYGCLIKELGISMISGNPTNKHTSCDVCLFDGV